MIYELDLDKPDSSRPVSEDKTSSSSKYFISQTTRGNYDSNELR